MEDDTRVPRDLYYSEDHTWVLVEDDLATVGITDHGQTELGEVVYVDLSDVGTSIDLGSAFGTLEAMKAVAELITPVTGEVVEINEALDVDPRQVNLDPYGEGWLIRVRWTDEDEIDSLMTPQDYLVYTTGESDEIE
jgi:glycine cleavage system H protein